MIAWGGSMDYANAGSGYEPDTIASVAAGVITITIMNNQNVSDLQGFQVINEGSKFGNFPGNRDSDQRFALIL